MMLGYAHAAKHNTHTHTHTHNQTQHTQMYFSSHLSPPASRGRTWDRLSQSRLQRSARGGWPSGSRWCWAQAPRSLVPIWRRDRGTLPIWPNEDGTNRSYEWAASELSCRSNKDSVMVLCRKQIRTICRRDVCVYACVIAFFILPFCERA